MIVAVPVLPSLLAVMIAGPALTPVTCPFPLTDAICVALLLHEIVRPVSVAPEASRTVADSVVDCPIVRGAVVGVTTTVATAGGGGGGDTVSPPPPHALRRRALRTNADCASREANTESSRWGTRRRDMTGVTK